MAINLTLILILSINICYLCKRYFCLFFYNFKSKPFTKQYFIYIYLTDIIVEVVFTIF